MYVGFIGKSTFKLKRLKSFTGLIMRKPFPNQLNQRHISNSIQQEQFDFVINQQQHQQQKQSFPKTIRNEYQSKQQQQQQLNQNIYRSQQQHQEEIRNLKSLTFEKKMEDAQLFFENKLQSKQPIHYSILMQGYLKSEKYESKKRNRKKSCLFLCLFV